MDNCKRARKDTVLDAAEGGEGHREEILFVQAASYTVSFLSLSLCISTILWCKAERAGNKEGEEKRNPQKEGERPHAFPILCVDCGWRGFVKRLSNVARDLESVCN